MSVFASRISNYPVVDDTRKAATQAYQWAKEKPNLTSIFSRIEGAALSLASLIKPVVESGVAHRLDDIACRQLLDRFESLCPILKESNTEELLGPVANRAVTLAETCADYCLPEDQPQPEVEGHEITRVDRLSHLKNRAHKQALSMFHTSVGRTHEMLSSLAESGSNLKAIPTNVMENTLNKAVSILNFAKDTAKSIGNPLIYNGLTTIKEQTEKLNGRLSESGSLNWIDLHNIVDGLDRLRTLIAEQPTTSTDEIEMQSLSQSTVVNPPQSPGDGEDATTGCPHDCSPSS